MYCVGRWPVVGPVYLSGCFGGDEPIGAAVSRAGVVLSAAVARAMAFPGSLPENTKAVWSRSGQRLSRRALFTLPPVSYVTTPTIDVGLCTAAEGCDQCVGACPHGALKKDADAISVSREECVGCGACVSVCPQRAVEFPGWSPDELEAQVSDILEARSDLGALPLAFVCRNAPRATPNGWLSVTVPCVSMVSTGAILTALAYGVDSVEVSGCADACPSKAYETLRGRVDFCQELLQSLGDASASERVCLTDPDQGAPKPIPPRRSGMETPDGPLRLFGRGISSVAIKRLVDHYGVEDLTLDHLESPVGLVDIDDRACTGCGTCAGACPTDALSFEGRQGQATLLFDASMCTACGQCESVCPERSEGAISLSRAVDLHRLRQGSHVVFQGDELRCERCGSVFATTAMMERITSILGDGPTSQLLVRRCPECRVL